MLLLLLLLLHCVAVAVCEAFVGYFADRHAA